MSWPRKPKVCSTSFIALMNFVLLVLQSFLFIHDRNHAEISEGLVSAGNNFKYAFATNYERKDWHDYEFINYEASRRGPGEQGERHELTDAADIARNEEIVNKEGLYGVVSDQISVNRSLPDPRMPE